MLLKAFVLFNLAAALSSATTEWYTSGNFYQIYPRSFKDSDNDGIGDLNGITSQLEYLKEIGIDGVWLSPIFKSPMVDFGYDISDFRDIQPEYGTMEDFERLTARCNELGIRLILDFVPNHSSDQHAWFEKSVNKEAGFEDFYIWHKGKINNATGKREPPSNWLAAFRFSAWEWNEKRQEYYLHQYAPQQPDLNFRSPLVVEEMKDTLRFWLKKGVAGFRVDTIMTLFEVAVDASGNYPDEPKSGDCLDDPQSHCFLSHIYTKDQDETYDMAYQWRAVLDEFGGDKRIMMTEAYSTLENIQRYYGDGIRNGSQIPFNFHLLTQTYKDSKATVYKRLIDEWLKNMPKDVEANWVLGNHDQKRIGSRLGEKRIDLYNILLKTLPGISITYQGEEIGMTDVIISWKDSVDPQACNTDPTRYHAVSRDPARTPFQWDGSENAGFNEGHKPWLPISQSYKCINVATEKELAVSHLNEYKKLVAIRKQLVGGTYNSSVYNNDVLTYERKGDKHILVVLNFGTQWHTIDLSASYYIPSRLKVLVASVDSQYRENDIIDAKKLTIPNDVGIVLEPLDT